MPLTNAEKQRRYREKLKNNPEKCEMLRKKHLERVKKNSKRIEDLNDNEKKRQRQQWRENSRRFYQKKKGIEIENNQIQKQIEPNDHKDFIIKKLKKKNMSLNIEIKKLNETVEFMKRKLKSMKKQVYRLNKKLQVPPTLQQEEQIETEEMTESEVVVPQDFTPRKKTEEYLKNINSKEDRNIVRPQILELNVLTAALQSEYKKSNNKNKQILKSVVNSPVTKKYKKVVSTLHTRLGLKSRIRRAQSKRTDKFLEIRNFFLRDDVTRATAGKKECVPKRKNAKNGVKIQKRFLLEPMIELYKKYKEEGGKASLTKFRRARPFYVCIPKLGERDTCACIKHSNLHFKSLKLKKLGVINTDNLNELVKQIACDTKNKDCMYNECMACKNRDIETILPNVNTEVSWLAWNLKTIPYTKTVNNEQIEKTTKKFVKEIVTNNIGTLVKQFQEEMKKFKTHSYNIQYQHKQFRICIDNLNENEAAIICDFSENFACKLHTEIQSMHFGGSRNQVSLHTGMLYTSKETLSFCTFSPSLEHNPASIWAHLEPIINHIKTNFPEVTKLHFFSDGPATQYRQKHNFFLLLQQTAAFDYCTWSYFEASHGKGPADGVGGSIKRALDSRIAYGNDITDAKMAFEILKGKTSVLLFYIEEEKINAMHKQIITNVRPICGTMRVHQIVTTKEPNKILHREVSCFCGEERGKCSCFGVKEHKLFELHQSDPAPSSSRTSKRRTASNRRKASKRRRKSSESSENENEIEVLYDDSDDSPYEERESESGDGEENVRSD